MSKYSEMDNMALQLEVAKRLYPDEQQTLLAEMVDSGFMPVYAWEDCYQVMDALLAITTGVNLKSDGTATTEINGRHESSGGGHCRAICELYLMAHDAEVKSDS